MKQVDFELLLLTDVSVPESARTQGKVRSLDYVPGRALWGVAAHRLFARGLDEVGALRWLRGGELRFHDAVPADGDGRSYPTPRSWHREKYARSGHDPVLNLVHDDLRDEIRRRQFQPLPAMWRGPGGREIVVEHRYSLRTAVTESGRTAEGLLFGIDSLPAGTRLHGRLSGVDEAVARVEGLLDGEDLLLGRSKSAEFGLVRCRVMSSPAEGLRLVSGRRSRVSFLCVSRLALRDPDTGAPDFSFRWQDFGLPDESWRLVPEASFVRVARYTPFNATWGRPESDRFVVEPGSVVTFQGAAEADLETVRRKVSSGVGLYRAEGLGEVVVQPEWLEDREVKVPSASGPDLAVLKSAEPPVDDELYQWASRRAEDRRRALAAFGWAGEHAKEFVRYSVPISQWGVMRSLARQARHRSDADRWLVGCVRNAVERGVSSLAERWGRRGKGGVKAGERLVRLLEAHRDLPADVPTCLELLAGAVMRKSAGGAE